MKHALIAALLSASILPAAEPILQETASWGSVKLYRNSAGVADDGFQRDVPLGYSLLIDADKDAGFLGFVVEVQYDGVRGEPNGQVWRGFALAGLRSALRRIPRQRGVEAAVVVIVPVTGAARAVIVTPVIAAPRTPELVSWVP